MLRRRWLPVLLILAAAALGCEPEPTASSQGASQPGQAAPPPPPPTEISLTKPLSPAIVIMYHDVVGRRGPGTLWYDVTKKELAEQLDFIEENGGSVVSMDDLEKSLVEGAPLPPRAVVLTFDDAYQGVYDIALPLLKERSMPATIYVHTDFVGSQVNRPKMTWEMHREAMATGLITIGAHTKSHPENLVTMMSGQAEEEIKGSKDILEKELGIEVRHFSWPYGKRSPSLVKMAKEAGLKTAVTMDSGLTTLSPGIMEIRRWSPTKLKEGWEELIKQESPLPTMKTVNLRPEPVTWVESEKHGIVRVSWIRGGMPQTHLVAGRRSVGEIIVDAGGVAGINGGFFAISDIQSQDNGMIGPCLARNLGVFYTDDDAARTLKLTGRPVVVFTENSISFVPYHAGFMASREDFEAIVPGAKDIFISGGWLVHEGRPLTEAEIARAATGDAFDFRRRAFLGVTADGVMVLGACLGSYKSDQLAEAAADLGCVEAVLLDSGFSTSLVVGERILASGHSTKEKPSRPVPHGIVLMGELGQPAPEAGVAKDAAEPTRRRR